MRRTLAVLVTAGAFLVPAGAASAEEVVPPAPETSNASCNNGKHGNYERTGHVFNGKGHVRSTADCASTAGPSRPVKVKDSEDTSPEEPEGGDGPLV